jgi:anti-anti-sigma factor
MTGDKQTCEFQREDQVLSCRFAGRLGSIECPAVEAQLEGHMANLPESVVFDLEHADFASSSFLRLCLRVAKQLEGGTLSIIHVSPLIKEVFAAAGFDRVPEIDVR